METEGGYLTPTDFAHALGLSRGETVREWCAEGKVPGAFRVSDKGKGRWRIPRASLGEYVRLRQAALRQAQGPESAACPDQARDADTPFERGETVGLIASVFGRKQYAAKRAALVRDITTRRRSCAEVREELKAEVARRAAIGDPVKWGRRRTTL